MSEDKLSLTMIIKGALELYALSIAIDILKSDFSQMEDNLKTLLKSFWV